MEEPEIRQSRLPRYRRHRHTKVPFVLQERDCQIVRIVADYRLITSAEIQALIPGSQQNLLRRLQRLFHASYLERPPDQRLRGNTRMVYALGSLGAQLLSSEGRSVSVDSEHTRSLSAQFLNHELMISRVHAVLTLATREHRDVVLESWRQGRELWDRVVINAAKSSQTLPVCPDAYFILRLTNEPEGQNRIHVFVECDRSTMTVKRFVEKMRGYWYYRQSGQQTKRYGIRNFLVVTASKSPERAANLITATAPLREATGSLRMFLFGCEQEFSLEAPEPILQPIWTSPGDPTPHSLLE